MGTGVYPPEILIIYLSKHPSLMFSRWFTIDACIGGMDGGSPCHVSILRKGHDHVTNEILYH